MTKPTRVRRMRWTGKRILILRRHYDETQKAFAARLGVSPSWLGNFEYGHRKIPLYVARLLDRLQQDAEAGTIQANPDPRYRKPKPMTGAEENTAREDQ